jgi:hypothetical protein
MIKSTLFLGLALFLPALAPGPTAGNGGPVLHRPGVRVAPVVSRTESLGARVCAPASAALEYYQIALVSTRRVPGSARANGAAEVFHASSPFSLSLAPDGSYVQRLEIGIEGLAPRQDGTYVVWVTTPNLDQVELLGTLDSEHRVSGHVRWNKFLVVISLEADPESLGPKWSGPIVLRGMSRSGLMHTLAGHGPFEQENCVRWGFY